MNNRPAAAVTIRREFDGTQYTAGIGERCKATAQARRVLDKVSPAWTISTTDGVQVATADSLIAMRLALKAAALAHAEATAQADALEAQKAAVAAHVREVREAEALDVVPSILEALPPRLHEDAQAVFEIAARKVARLDAIADLRLALIRAAALYCLDMQRDCEQSARRCRRPDRKDTYAGLAAHWMDLGEALESVDESDIKDARLAHVRAVLADCDAQAADLEAQALAGRDFGAEADALEAVTADSIDSDLATFQAEAADNMGEALDAQAAATMQAVYLEARKDGCEDADARRHALQAVAEHHAAQAVRNGNGAARRAGLALAYKLQITRAVLAVAAFHAVASPAYAAQGLQVCTTPAAPFYTADSVILGVLEAQGVDLPCNVITGLGGGLMVLFLGLIVMGVWAAVSLAREFRRNRRESRRLARRIARIQGVRPVVPFVR
jgi:hypothetical protein